MTEAYTTIVVTDDPTGSNNSTEANQEVNQLVYDVNAMYETMYNIGLSQDEVDDLIDKMVADSNSADYSSAGQAAVNLDIIQVLIEDSNSIAGALSLISQMITVTADMTNLVNTAEGAFVNMSDEATTQLASEDPESGVTADGYKGSAEETQDEENLSVALDAFNNTEFTIYYANGGSTTVNGILNVLSNNSQADGYDPSNLSDDDQFWGDSGFSPMDATTATLINEDIEDIQGHFSDWEDPTSYYDEIVTWATPVETTNDESSNVVYSSTDEISEVSNDFGQAASALEDNAAVLNNNLSYGMTLYEQLEGAIEEIIDSNTSEEGYAVQHTGT